MSQSALEVNLDALATAGRAEVRDGRGAWIRLHSARDPRTEARGQAAELTHRAVVSETIVLIGGGLGYLAEALLEAHAHRVIVIEPSADLARACLSRRDWSAWRDTGRFELRVWPDIDEPAPLWQLFDRDEADPLVVVQPVVARVAADLTHQIHEQAKRIVFEGRANAGARRRQAGRYLRNTLNNLGPIARSADAGALQDALQGVPAILVAAGPSLDALLPALADASDKAAIIAVDTALRPLLNAGIAPHLVVALDPTELNARHLMDLPPREQTWLVAEPSLDPRAVAPFGDRLFTFRVADHHPWPWLAQHGVTRQLLRVWGSVLTAALDLAILSGADPIVFAGADLAYTGGRPYCRGTAWENGWADLTGRGGALEKQFRADLAARATQIATDVHGRPTTTTPHLVAFRDWLVGRMAEETGRQFINASGDGLLAGDSIDQARLRDIHLGMPGTGRIVRDRINALSAAGTVDSGSVRARLHAQLQDVLADAPESPRATWLEFGKATMSMDALDRTVSTASESLASGDVRPTTGVEVPIGLLPAADCASLLYAALHSTRANAPAPGSQCPGIGSSVEAIGQLRKIFSDLRRTAAPAVRGDLSAEAGLVPASLLFTPSPEVQPRLRRFEDTLARLVTPEPPPFIPIDSRAALRGVASGPDDAALPLLLLHELLSVLARSAERERVDAPATIRWALERVLSAGTATANVAENGPSLEVTVNVLTGADRQTDMTELTKRLVGLVGIERPGLARSAPVRIRSASSHEPELRVLDLPLVRVPVERLSLARLAPAGMASVLDETSAIVTPGDSRASFRIWQNGGIEPLERWPRPIWGEIPWGTSGGGFAWHPPDRVLLFRASTRSRPVLCDAPFSPLRVAPLEDGSSLWCASEGGVWRWEPGRPEELLVETPAPAHLRLVDGAVRIDPATRLPDGAHVRKRLSQACLWRIGSSALEQVALDDDGQCTSYSASGQWAAEAHAYADVVKLRGPNGLRARLTAYYPLIAAWAGSSLVLCTGEWEVLFFPSLADRLASAVQGSA
jgi:6-hydroxymethylpterin diphosphokinase MptE-like